MKICGVILCSMMILLKAAENGNLEQGGMEEERLLFKRLDQLDEERIVASEKISRYKEELSVLWNEITVSFQESEAYKKMLSMVDPLDVERQKKWKRRLAKSDFDYVVAKERFYEKQTQALFAQKIYNEALLEEYQLFEDHNFEKDKRMEEEYKIVTEFMHNHRVNDQGVE